MTISAKPLSFTFANYLSHDSLSTSASSTNGSDLDDFDFAFQSDGVDDGTMNAYLGSFDTPPTPSVVFTSGLISLTNPNNLLGAPASPAGSVRTTPGPYDTVTVKTTGVTFNLEFVQADNPTANFESEIEAAAGLLSSAIHNQITVNLEIGYGEVDGSALTDGSAAANPDNGQYVSYATVRQDLIADAASGDPNFNALPSGSSIGGQTQIAVWNAQLKALGLISANDATTDDGDAGFATDIPSDDLIGVALHELTHAMGRVPDAPNPDIMEFFRFSSAGVNVFSDDDFVPSYFSVDGGVTKLADYGEDSDPSDFANSNNGEGTPISSLTPEDPFDQYYDSDTIQHLTSVDLTQLDVLGFNTFTSNGSPPSVVHNVSITVADGQTVTITSSELEFDDAVSAHAQETYTIVTAPADGTLLKSGVAASSFTQADIDNGLISYLVTNNGASSDSFSFTVTDAGGNTTTTQQFHISISDTIPPTLVHDTSLGASDGQTIAISANQLEFDDNVSSHAQEIYTILTQPAYGVLLKNGVATTTFTQADIDNGLITYEETNLGALSDSFTFKVTDAAGNSTTTQQFQISIADKTPPAVVHESSISVADGHTVAISASELEFDDNVSAHAQETYTILTAPADGTLLKNGVATSTFTQADIDNGLISYQETNDDAASDSFTFKVTDAADNATATQQFQISILDIIPPTLVHDSSVSVASGATVMISSSELEFDDNVSTHAQETYTITSGPADGSLLRNGLSVSAFTQADLDNGLISYHETASNFSSDSFSFTVTDASGNTTTTRQLQLSLSNGIAPSLVHDNMLSVSDGQTVAISASELEFDDVVSPHAQVTYTILSAPTDGTLLRNGAATTTFTQADIDNGLISYQETNNEASSDLFTFKVTDAAGNATTTQQMQIAISDIVPPSLIHDGPVSVAADGSVVISASQLEFDDNVSTNAQETYTILSAPADGALLMNGAAVTTFTQADLDNGLISYKETGAFVSSDSFAFKVTDAAGNATTTEQFQIAVQLESARLYDFNGDGVADILWRTRSGDVKLWLSNDSNGYTIVDVGPVAESSKIVGVGDFDGDGKADILWKASNGALSLWLSNGLGGFTHDPIGNAPAGLHVVGVGDFSGGSEAGILWRSANGAVSVWDPNGQGGFTSKSLGSLSTNWQVAGIGDFNGDGDADILWRNVNGAVKLWDLNGSGIYTQDSLGTVSTSWSIVGVADFNGDGEADILWRNANGTMALWYGNGLDGFKHKNIGSVPTGWQVVGVGDFNGGQEAGILWRKPSGALVAWDSNGAGGFTHVNLGSANTGWAVEGG